MSSELKKKMIALLQYMVKTLYPEKKRSSAENCLPTVPVMLTWDIWQEQISEMAAREEMKQANQVLRRFPTIL